MTPERFGRYEIRAELARGGMATVYHAYDPRFRRDVALKILPRELHHVAEFRERFAREAVAVAQLEHPAIVPVHDFGEEDGQSYLVMRLMRGGSLSDRIRQRPLTLMEAVRVLGPVARALDFAHSKGIIHRDIKPANILFDESGEPYLTDFGILKLLGGEGRTLTATGGLMGTPAYMSPEQVQGLPVDGRSDVYGLGAVYYVMLTGKRPYESDTPMGLALKHVLDPVPDILAAAEGLPAMAQEVIERAMAKKPADRYPTAGAFAEATRSLAAQGETRPTRAVAGPPAVSALPDPTGPDTERLPTAAVHPGAPTPAAATRRAWKAPLVGTLIAAALIALCACGALAAWQLGLLPPGSAAATTVLTETAPAGGGDVSEGGTATPTTRPAETAGAPGTTGTPGTSNEPPTGTPTTTATEPATATPTASASPSVTPIPTDTPTPTETPGPVTYAITVATSCDFLAGTDARVFIHLYGENGDSGATLLDRAEINDFETCETNTYLLTLEADLGELTQIEIWHDNSGLFAGWKLEWVNVTNQATEQEWFFPCARWLASDEGDGATFRRIMPGGPCQ